MRHNARVVYAAAGHDQIRETRGEAAGRERDRHRRQHRRGGHEIPHRKARLLQPFHEGRAILLATRALGRLAAVISIGQQVVEQRGIHAAGFGDLPAAVVRLPHLTGERVDRHVAGAGIECHHSIGRCACRNHRDVGYASDIERDARAGPMAEQQIIHVRNQRRSLAPGGDIARAKIRDYRQAGAFRDDRRFADLQGIRSAFVIDGLPVAADQLHGAEALHGAQHRTRVQLSQLKAKPRDGRGLRGGVGDRQNRVAHQRGERRRLESDGFDAAALDLNDGHVDAVERSPAHHAGHSHWRFSSFWSSLSNCNASMGRSSSRLMPRMRSAIP